MMLRSTSTQSLVSSLSESPTRKRTTPPTAACGQVSCKCNNHTTAAKSAVNSPDGTATEIRRAQSAGNLEAFHVDDFTLSRQSSKRLSRTATLEAISASFYGNVDDEEEEEEEVAEGNLNLFTVQNLVAHEATREFSGFCDVGEGKMYLATGIGVSAIGFLDDAGFGGSGGGGGSCRPGDYGRDSGDSRGLSLESHYKNMLVQCPGNPLLLRNYAHFLYQVTP